MPGQFFKPVFAKDADWRRPIWYYHEGNRALHLDGWKIVAEKDGPWELFNLREDRSESLDLAESHSDKVLEMEEIWNRMLLEFREVTPEKSEVP